MVGGPKLVVELLRGNENLVCARIASRIGNGHFAGRENVPATQALTETQNTRIQCSRDPENGVSAKKQEHHARKHNNPRHFFCSGKRLMGNLDVQAAKSVMNKTNHDLLDAVPIAKKDAERNERKNPDSDAKANHVVTAIAQRRCERVCSERNQSETRQKRRRHRHAHQSPKTENALILGCPQIQKRESERPERATQQHRPRSVQISYCLRSHKTLLLEVS